MRKSIMSRPGMRRVAALAIAASLLGTVPAHSAQAAARPAAAPGLSALADGSAAVSSTTPAPGPTVGIASSDAAAAESDAAPDSADTTEGDNPDAGTNTTADERFAAGAVIGWSPRDELSMSDKDFVIVLWEKADEYFHPEVKKAAKEAFAEVTDPGASATFIQAGVFEANNRDAALKVVRAQRDTERLSAAQELGWVPADDEARQGLLRSTISNFLLQLSRKAEAGSQVRKGAEDLVEATEEEQLAFIGTGVHDAAKADRDKKIADGREKELAEQQAQLLRDIKSAAIVAALDRVATPFELEFSTERDLIYKIKTEALGAQVKAAGAVAYGSEKAEDWRAFLATGVHVARAADIAERDRLEAAEDERKVREVLNNAKFDKYQPNLAAAANRALQGNATARSQFLEEIADGKTAKFDVVQPIQYMTIALQGTRSKRCLQVAGAVDKPNVGGNADKAPMELWDCNENARQRWELIPVAGGKFVLQSTNAKKCLEVPAGKNAENVRLIQNPCVTTSAQQQWVFVDTGKYTMELRSVASNKVVTAASSATANAAAVIQQNNTHTVDQQWRVIDFSHHQLASAPLTGKVSLKGLLSGKCIEVVGSTAKPNEGANADKAPMQLWTCNKTPRQVWEFVKVSGNRFALKNTLKGKCLDVLGGSAASGAAVIQYGCHLHASEQWVLMSAGTGGTYLVRNALTGTYVNVLNAGTANASKVHAWPYTGNNNQRWTPVPIG